MKISYYRRPHAPNARRSYDWWFTLSLCAPGVGPGARPGARSLHPPVSAPASQAPSRPATLRPPPAGSDRPPAAGALPTLARRLRPPAESPSGVGAVLYASQAPSSANLTLSLSSSILAPAAFRRIIESGRSTFRL